VSLKRCSPPDTPSSQILAIVSSLLAGKAVKRPREELLRLQSVLLQGKDVHKPEGMAAKLLACMDDVSQLYSQRTLDCMWQSPHSLTHSRTK
jgi:hypothetical protein